MNLPVRDSARTVRGHPARVVLATGLFLAAAGVLEAAQAVQLAPAGELARPRNVVVVCFDDLGVRKVGWTPSGKEALSAGLGGVAKTPNLDALAATAVIYRWVHANPKCSPSRATMMTGRPAWATGIGDNLSTTPGVGLAQSEISLAEAVKMSYSAGQRDYVACGYFGKWHLSDGPDDVCDQGWDFFDGTLRNLAPGNYYAWKRTRDVGGPGGRTAKSWVETEYITTATVDSALGFVRARQAENRPYVAWVALHAPHKPFHVPPLSLQSTAGLGETDDLVRYLAAVEAADTELLRLFAELDWWRTVVIVTSDNGPPDAVADQPEVPGQMKGTGYRGGVHVPLFVCGAGVPAWGLTDGLGGSTGAGRGLTLSDLFATVVTLSGAPPVPDWVPHVDSLSLIDPKLPGLDWMPRRAALFTELWSPNGSAPSGPFSTLWRTWEFPLGKSRWKLIRRAWPGDDADEFYEVKTDPWEALDLLEGNGGAGALSLTPHAADAYMLAATALQAAVP